MQASNNLLKRQCRHFLLMLSRLFTTLEHTIYRIGVHFSRILLPCVHIENVRTFEAIVQDHVR
jgi:hypothetical protein